MTPAKSPSGLRFERVEHPNAKRGIAVITTMEPVKDRDTTVVESREFCEGTNRQDASAVVWNLRYDNRHRTEELIDAILKIENSLTEQYAACGRTALCGVDDDLAESLSLRGQDAFWIIMKYGEEVQDAIERLTEQELD